MIGIYVRVSTEEQAKKGFSLKDQVDQCRKKANSDEIIEYIDDGVSGEFLDRPALTNLRKDIKDGLITKVICYDPDRLSRKLMNQLLVSDEIEKNASLIFVNGEYQKTPEGMLFYQMRGAIAEFEKAKINERMSNGRRQKARQGKIVKDPKIYGYIYNKEKSQLEINEAEAEVVKIIFDLFTKPNGKIRGINGIAHYLTDRKVPTKRGAKVWHRQVVRQLLMNEAYIGHFYNNRWNTEGMLGNKHRSSGEKISMVERPKEEWIEIPCPKIIDEQTFSHAQRLLKESRRRWAKEGLRKYLLSGLIRCGECRNTMTGRQSKNWGTIVPEYSDRKNTAGAKYTGCGMHIKAEEIEIEVWEKVKGWLNHPDEIAAASESETETQTARFEESEVLRIKKEIEKAQEGRKRLLNLFAQGLDISEEEIRGSLKDLKEKEEQLNSQLHDLEDFLNNIEDQQQSQMLLVEAANYYLDKGEHELTFEDKQELIRHVVREIVVYKDKVEILLF